MYFETSGRQRNDHSHTIHEAMHAFTHKYIQNMMLHYTCHRKQATTTEVKQFI